jgi:proteic killer suppression protein
VVDKLLAWVEAVEEDGLEATRRVPGFHDEPLKGKRRGQRSIRLSRQWRAIYEIRTDGNAQLVSVEEVTPHVY